MRRRNIVNLVATAGLVAAGLLFARTAGAQPVRPNILFIFDTSTSMLLNGGDGSPLCMNQGMNSRFFRLKQAIRETLTEVGTDEANFGLARFPQRTTPATDRGCYRGHYINAIDTGANLGCKTTAAIEAPDGAWFLPDIASEFVVVPVTGKLPPPDSNDYDPPGANVVTIHRWLNNVEISDGVTMTEPEIRVGGPKTPLAASLFYARLYFQRYVKPNDPRMGCRKDIVILVTDGAETCGGDAPQAAEDLYKAGVELYVVVQLGEVGTVHDQIASRGSGGKRPASLKVDFLNPAATKAALIGIIAESVPPGEICNGKDDNCNGDIDNMKGIDGPLPDVGGPCLCPGLTEEMVGKGMCKKGNLKCVAGALVCEGCVGPGEEVCNGIDDNCNGLIDENLPNVGKECACPPLSLEMLNTGECRAGKNVCKGKMPLDCEGCVGPVKEICDCKDNNCNGMKDEGNPCGAGFACVGCKCELLCGEGEFRCPTGYACDTSMMPPVCKSLKCVGKVCPAGSSCEEGTGECKDKCANVTCVAPQTCLDGRCVDCYSLGCPAGQQCRAGLCQKDPCAGKKCKPDQFCNEKGVCTNLCTSPCPPGQRCAAGTCQVDKCAPVTATCIAGEVCDPVTLTCKADRCRFGACSAGQRCVPATGECKDDPCATIKCPNGCYKCDVATDGTGFCGLLKECQAERIEIATQGGGCSCGVGGRGALAGGALAGLWLTFAVVVHARSRRRRR